MIKDVSKQWAAILESDEAADAAYGVACEEACNEADEIKQAEIDNFDEAEVSLEECGLADQDDLNEAEELTEEDEAAAEEKATKAFEEVKKETKGMDSADEVKEYFEKNKADIEKNIAKFKDKDTRDRLTKIMKILEKVANGEVQIEESDTELDEAKKTKSAPAQFIKGALRIFVWMLKIAPLALLGTAWVSKKIGQASKWVLDKADAGLAEDENAEKKKPIDECDEVIDADGVSLKEADMSMVCCGKALSQWFKDFNGEFTPDQLQKMALSGTDLQKLLLNINGQSSLEDSEINEADYREPAAHLLDAVGVNASTASLKAQDTAMIGVVETLLKKIDKLEDRLDESQKRSNKKLSESYMNNYKMFYRLDSDRARKNRYYETRAESISDAIYSFDDDYDEQSTYSLDNIIFLGMTENGEDITAEAREIFDSIVNEFEESEKLAEDMMEEACNEADTQLDDEVDPDYPEFDEKGLTASQRKDYEAAAKIQELSFERKLTKAEEEEFLALLDKLPELAKDYLLSNNMGKSGFARPGNHVGLKDPTMPVDDGGGPEHNFKVHFTGDKQEIAPFRYQVNPEDIFQKRSLEKRAQRAAEAVAKKNKKIEIPMRGQDVWSIEDWTKMYNSMDKSTKKEWLDDMINDIHNEYGSDTENAELQIAMLKRAVGKKITDDDIKDLIVGLTGKEMTKQGAGKRSNLYAKAIRMAFVQAMDKSLTSDIKQKILQGIKIPGATGLSSIGIPDKLLVKMTEDQFGKFIKLIRIQIDSIQKRKGGSFKSEEPTDDELAAIDAGDDSAGEVQDVAESMMEDAIEDLDETSSTDKLGDNGDSIDEDEITDMNKFFEA